MVFLRDKGVEWLDHVISNVCMHSRMRNRPFLSYFHGNYTQKDQHTQTHTHRRKRPFPSHSQELTNDRQQPGAHDAQTVLPFLRTHVAWKAHRASEFDGEQKGVCLLSSPFDVGVWDDGCDCAAISMERWWQKKLSEQYRSRDNYLHAFS